MKAKNTLIGLPALSVIKLYPQGTSIKGLKIGDKIPEVVLESMKNYPGTKAKLSDFKGKLVILDFWSTLCAPCIAAFPKMESLQNEFGDKIQVLLVTNNSLSLVNGLCKRSPIAKKTNLPFVTGNTQLYELFPHTSEPYHVWIDENGTVKALTHGYNTTSEHIADFLRNKNIELPVRLDLVDWDDEDYRSLLQEGHGRQWEYLQYSSILMNHIPGINISTEGPVTDSISSKMIGLKMLNIDIKSLYQDAYSGTIPGFLTYWDDRIILEVPHPESYIIPKDGSKMDEWVKKNLFCYELRIKAAASWTCPPDTTYARLRKIFREDLERYFFKATPEKRTLKCWVLVRTANENKLKTSGGNVIFDETKNGNIIRNFPVRDFLAYIMLENRGVNTPPVVDETGYTGNVDMDINCSLDDIPHLRKELAKYGLGLIEAERQIDVLVLRENKDL